MHCSALSPRAVSLARASGRVSERARAAGDCRRRGQMPVTGALPDAWAGDGDNSAGNLATHAKGRSR